jgi:hypothetical protein
VATWLQVVEAATKMNRQRLLRFGLESILAETLKGMTFTEGDDIPILPPVAYKAVEGLVQVLIPQSMLISAVACCSRSILL